ncbi:hypothetical protein ACJIZ3_016037 [Penstemon smallii]|uniref:Bifunctional inhibitor/plant lipid transfer protein/seed storage helical domain-containing protein n=1 Tax=Penstemon smallii TaxID=265156 RepID=A0ABD3RQ13_9LAMI
MHKYSPTYHKPNEKCCASARKKYMIKLFCKVFVVKETEKVFNPAKLAVIASHCGNPLPRGTRCGSHIVH